MSASYKSKKICSTVLTSLKKDHGLEPGSMVKTKNNAKYMKVVKNKISKEHILLGIPDFSSCIIRGNSYLLFVDFVFSPVHGKHYFVFLADERLVAVDWRKKYSSKHLKDWLEVVGPSKEDDK